MIDCHSFPSKPLPYQIVRGGDFPEICIGTDYYHTPKDLRDAILVGFADQVGGNAGVTGTVAG